MVLPHADYTSIGERGVNLSGGQKARVSVARALYAGTNDNNTGKCELCVFDDPLASVDVHVGKALFTHALTSPMLRDKARVLVMSSNYHLLPLFDKVRFYISLVFFPCSAYRIKHYVLCMCR